MNTFKTLLVSLLLSLALIGTAVANERVNINTADAATLARVLHNVGPTKAQAIVVYRQEHGPFRSAEQLALVKGIGLATVERNRERIVVTAAPAQRPAATAAAPRASASNSAPPPSVPLRR